jgi:hypothetical protein
MWRRGTHPVACLRTRYNSDLLAKSTVLLKHLGILVQIEQLHPGVIVRRDACSAGFVAV